MALCPNISGNSSPFGQARGPRSNRRSVHLAARVAMGTRWCRCCRTSPSRLMDREILAVEGIFYARYNDDFLLAHPDLTALREADARIDRLVAGLGVKRKPLPRKSGTALGARGTPSDEDPAYRGATGSTAWACRSVTPGDDGGSASVAALHRTGGVPDRQDGLGARRTAGAGSGRPPGGDDET